MKSTQCATNDSWMWYRTNTNVSHLKTRQEVSKNTAELQVVRKKKHYFLFSQTGKTEHSNDDVMLSIKTHPKYTGTFILQSMQFSK